MSAEGGSSQPPPIISEKVPIVKSATTFSSFINKNTTGKKVAPKAARRRPGAGATAVSTPKASAPVPEAGSTQIETPPAIVPIIAVSQAAEQLPTPAATQETAAQSNSQKKHDVAGPSGSIAEHSVAAPALVDAVKSVTNISEAPQQEKEGGNTGQLSSIQSSNPRHSDEKLESGRLPKRRRIDLTTAEDSTQPKPVPTPLVLDTNTIPLIAQIETQPTNDSAPEQSSRATLKITQTASAASTTDPPTKASGNINQDSGAGETPLTDVSPPTQQAQPRKGRRKLPWVTVNQSLDEEAEATEAESRARTRPIAQARSKRKVVVSGIIEDEEYEAHEETGEEQRAPLKGVNAKARGKRKAASAAEGDDADAAGPSAKKPRKTRKDKGITRKKQVEQGDGEEGEAAEESTAPPKKKATRKKKVTTNSVEPGGDIADRNGEGNDQQSNRRGRQREPTPSDAEGQEIDPANTFMSGLAARNIRVGKLSERERKMREIKWDEVRQRRREEEATAVDGGRNTRNQVDEELARAGAARDEATAQQSSGPQLREIDGQIVLVQDSGTINREAEADRMIELMEEVDEDDLTAPINSRSYMRLGKRFPNDFMLPGQGRRWTAEGTELFYDGLQMWGTNFEIISYMFPGTTRKSVKKKFNREEKESPERVKEALAAPRCTDWDLYLKLSGRTNEAHANVEVVKKELAELQIQADVLIKKAQEDATEERRQRRLAGAETTDDEAVNGTSNENGLKKKGKKGKTVNFAQDSNLEVLGTIDDDPNWGVEA